MPEICQEAERTDQCHIKRMNMSAYACRIHTAGGSKEPPQESCVLRYSMGRHWAPCMNNTGPLMLPIVEAPE